MRAREAREATKECPLPKETGLVSRKETSPPCRKSSGRKGKCRALSLPREVCPSLPCHSPARFPWSLWRMLLHRWDEPQFEDRLLTLPGPLHRWFWMTIRCHVVWPSAFRGFYLTGVWDALIHWRNPEPLSIRAFYSMFLIWQSIFQG